MISSASDWLLFGIYGRDDGVHLLGDHGGLLTSKWLLPIAMIHHPLAPWYTARPMSWRSDEK